MRVSRAGYDWVNITLSRDEARVVAYGLRSLDHFKHDTKGKEYAATCEKLSKKIKDVVEVD